MVYLSTITLSLNTLQEMLSSHQNAKQSVSLLHNQRELPSLKLCGNIRPCVNGGKHLGNAIKKKVKGMQLQIKQK